MTYGEHPPFSPAELAEIRRLATSEKIKVHQIKNETAVPSHRDALTERLQTLERIEEKIRDPRDDGEVIRGGLG